MKVRLSERALADIANIRNYLAKRSPQGAENVRVAIDDAFNLLEQFPRIGRESDIKDIRMLPVVRYRYLVYYSISAGEIGIVHVRHGSRDAPKADEL